MTGFDRDTLIAACAEHGRVCRVVVADVRGSAPREIGAAMLVWQGGFSGTIGGGTLEYQAILAARASLSCETPTVTQHALGPDLGQCCGGAVTLMSDPFDEKTATALPKDVVARGTGDMPLRVQRVLSLARSEGRVPSAQFLEGWMIEPVAQPSRHVWIWGAGHVGQALVGALSPLPDVSLSWIDTSAARFLERTPEGVEIIAADKPARLVRHAPIDTQHLIVTYSHALDLELCHQLLSHRFGYAGLIGSKTKWARFRKRLVALGHGPGAIEQITCPIGQPEFGKHPQAIALGVAADFLARWNAVATDDVKGFG